MTSHRTPNLGTLRISRGNLTTPSREPKVELEPGVTHGLGIYSNSHPLNSYQSEPKVFNENHAN